MNDEVVQSLNSLRVLSVDMISMANSGHPGIALSAAPIIYSLFAYHLRFNPNDPNWINRDRFVMSAGHGSALLYATLFMAGYDISIDDLVSFRRINSKTPGYPQYGVTPGVEITAGGPGEGFANAVGMAIAEKYLSAVFTENLPKQKLLNYKVFSLISDTDLMEGVFQEAASLAGTLGLDNLVVLYDSCGVTFDGLLSNVNRESVIRKFIDMGWEVDFVSEGNDTREIDKALERAKVNKKPTLIEVQTVLGRGSLNEGKNLIYAKPLSKEDVANVRQRYNVTTNVMEISEKSVNTFRRIIANRMGGTYEAWKKEYDQIKATTVNPELKKIINFLETKDIAIDFSSSNFKIQNDYSEELRESNSKIMNIVSDRTKFFVGGSADLASACHTALYKEIFFSNKYANGKNISFGNRERAMGAILNGISMSGLRTFGSTYLAFADNLKAEIRMSAMMKLPVTYIFSHDSVAIGQDGPAFQPVEQLTMLRSIPNLVVLRPADINEVIGSWDFIVNNSRPVALVLANGDAHIMAGTNGLNVKLGGYVVKKETQRLDAVLVSTGIDFMTTYLISEELRSKGFDLRVVSMPSMELFFEQPLEYRESVIPSNAKVFTIEAGSTLGWYKVASKGCAIGIDDFGSSGFKNDVLMKVGFDYESILKKIEDKLKGN